MSRVNRFGFEKRRANDMSPGFTTIRHDVIQSLGDGIRCAIRGVTLQERCNSNFYYNAMLTVKTSVIYIILYVTLKMPNP
jgi:hypothetical protein